MECFSFKIPSSWKSNCHGVWTLINNVFQIELLSEDDEFKYLSATKSETQGARIPIYSVHVSSNGKSWVVRRSYENFEFLDRQAHQCIWDRKYSQLPVIPQEENVTPTNGRSHKVSLNPGTVDSIFSLNWIFVQLVFRSEKGRCQFLFYAAPLQCQTFALTLYSRCSALKLQQDSCGFSSFHIRKEITRLTLCFSRFNAVLEEALAGYPLMWCRFPVNLSLQECKNRLHATRKGLRVSVWKKCSFWKIGGACVETCALARALSIADFLNCVF